MAFQFLCPQGHLLQGEESQAGQQCKCPYCESVFIVPAPQPPAATEPTEPEPTPPPGMFPEATAPGPAPQAPAGPDFGWANQQPQQQPQVGPSQFGPPQADAPDPGAAFPGIQADPGTVGAGPSVSEMPGAAAFVHILCPSGHELETPREMLGQDAICPYCQMQFRLRFEDSLEYRKEKEAERERMDMRKGKAWMQWSIAAAVVVILGVILMIVMATAR